MDIWSQIAMWGGVAGLFVSVLAIVLLFLIRKNILDIVNKDIILFDKNFEYKNHIVQEALTMVDELLDKGSSLAHNPPFSAKAKMIYNSLLCVLSDMKIAQEFYHLMFESPENINHYSVSKFKIDCRADIGLSTNKVKAIKGLTHQHPDAAARSRNIKPSNNFTIPSQSSGTQQQNQHMNDFASMGQAPMQNANPMTNNQPMPNQAFAYAQQPTQPANHPMQQQPKPTMQTNTQVPPQYNKPQATGKQ